MPSPELIDERFDEIVRELRALPAAPDTLRKRVLDLADVAPLQSRRPWRSQLSLRVTGWTLATTAAGIVAVSLVYGLATSGRHGDDELAAAGGTTAEAQSGGAHRLAPIGKSAPPPWPQAEQAAPPPAATVDGRVPGSAGASPTALESGLTARDAVTLPPGKRLAQYTASMRLRVSDVDELSRTTREAMRIARRLGGFVASVNYGTPKGDEGDASLTLRVPAAHIQQAIAQLSDLGVIVSQRIKITDLQDRVNDDTSAIARLQRSIRRLEARLKEPISADERFRLELQLEQARRSLRVLTVRRDSTVRRARLATISLALTTREADEQPAAPPGRIERAARNAASLLSKEVAAAVYFLIAASPLLLLGAAALVAARAQRRRFEQRLLEQA